MGHSPPNTPYFRRTRSDVYEWTGVLAEFQRWEQLDEDPNRLLDANHIRFCILARRSPMAIVMTLLPDWELPTPTPGSVLFVRA